MMNILIYIYIHKHISTKKKYVMKTISIHFVQSIYIPCHSSDIHWSSKICYLLRVSLIKYNELHRVPFRPFRPVACILTMPWEEKAANILFFLWRWKHHYSNKNFFNSLLLINWNTAQALEEVISWIHITAWCRSN